LEGSRLLMNRSRIVLLAALILAGTACHHVDKKEQLAALDDAYQAGLLTKDEYDAKKLALTGTPASVPAVAPAPSSTPASTPQSATVPPQVSEAPPQSNSPRRHARAVSPASSAPAAAPVESPRVPVATSSPSESSSPRTNLHSNEPAPLPGCEDAEYKSGGQKGPEERFFAAPVDVVKNAALSALESLDFNIRKKSKKEIEASKKRHLGAIVGAGGERVIIRFEPSERKGTAGTRVTGETKKNFVGHVSQKTWTDAVLAEMACKLSESSR
jgi:hypothetical protein